MLIMLLFLHWVGKTFKTPFNIMQSNTNTKYDLSHKYIAELAIGESTKTEHYNLLKCRICARSFFSIALICIGVDNKVAGECLSQYDSTESK